MTYSELTDFQEKETDISTMNTRLSTFGQPLVLKGATVLEIGGAGGIFSGLLADEADWVVCTDIINHQAKYNGEFPRLLKEKFDRNGYELNLERTEFHTADATSLPYKNDLFDVVVSINAFEHIPDPVMALNEAIRVTRPGGLIYISFDPIWTADTGNHFPSFAEPWEHLLCSTEEFIGMMKEKGASDFEMSDFRYGMNRKPAWFYSTAFPEIACQCVDFKFEAWKGCVTPEHVNHPNRFHAAELLAQDPDQFLIRGFSICIKK